MTSSWTHSVKVRLAAWFAVCIALCSVLLTGASLVLLQHATMREVDRVLRSDVAALSEMQAQQPQIFEGDLSQLRSVHSPASIIEVWRVEKVSGRVDAHHRLIAAPSLPATDTSWRMERTALVELFGNDRHSIVMQASMPAPWLGNWRSIELAHAVAALLAFLVLSAGLGLFMAVKAAAPARAIILQARRAVAGDLGARMVCEDSTDEFAELCRVINGLREDTEKAMLRQAKFATEAAHELRTPLTAQRSVGELALQGVANVPVMRDAIASMLEEGEHMHRLIESLLTVARADGGLLSGNESRVDVPMLAERCVRSMMPLAESKGQTLTLMAESALFIRADETLIRQAVLNLIHNASEHTPGDTIIDVTALRTSAGVTLRISDNGPGFPTPQSGRLIHRYNRRKGDRRARGLGMGLTIARSLVRSQGGSLVVHSQVGLGTVVELNFPEEGDQLSAAAAAIVPADAGSALH